VTRGCSRGDSRAKKGKTKWHPATKAAATPHPPLERMMYHGASFGRSDCQTISTCMKSRYAQRISSASSAILYLGTITFFFFIGGAAVALIRYNLIVPQGVIGSAETCKEIKQELESLRWPQFTPRGGKPG
jgi:hypothetical protein